MASAAWGVDSPVMDEGVVRDIDSRLSTPPDDARALRCIVAATGAPLVEGLRQLGYYPDMRLQPKSSAERVREALVLVGFHNAKLISVDGRRVLLEL